VGDVTRTPEHELVLEAARAENFVNPQTPEEWAELTALLGPDGTPQVVRRRGEGAEPPRR
jgi:hypothetical protein